MGIAVGEFVLHKVSSHFVRWFSLRQMAQKLERDTAENRRLETDINVAEAQIRLVAARLAVAMVRFERLYNQGLYTEPEDYMSSSALLSKASMKVRSRLDDYHRTFSLYTVRTRPDPESLLIQSRLDLPTDPPPCCEWRSSCDYRPKSCFGSYQRL